MGKTIKLGIAGLGTVGVGLIEIIQNHGATMANRSGQTIEISAVSARSRTKDRGVDLSGYDWEDDAVKLAARDDIDVFVELIGGDSGPAKAAVEAALKAGKHVVTANKALLALHGQALAQQAETAGRVIRFEAGVAGGIPVIKALTEGLADADRLSSEPSTTAAEHRRRFADADTEHPAGVATFDRTTGRYELLGPRR